MAHVICNTTCTTAGPDGARIRLREGVVWEDTDPMVIFRPDLFRHLDNTPRRTPVEQTTAAPGEQRKTTRARKQTDG
jgi:hypothetical protein